MKNQNIAIGYITRLAFNPRHTRDQTGCSCDSSTHPSMLSDGTDRISLKNLIFIICELICISHLAKYVSNINGVLYNGINAVVFLDYLYSIYNGYKESSKHQHLRLTMYADVSIYLSVYKAIQLAIEQIDIVIAIIS